ncbi:MAG TPA: RimK/LysX family protein, partial [Bacteroidales bacterium]|nr:RimK/LysX family protein [Bacteroidales bacterium]
MQTYLDADYDIRVHVLGDKVIAAMKRFKIKKDFRSNYSLGGKIEKVDLTEEQEKIAINAAQAVGAVWAGVDIITNKKDKKNYVIEINSSPGTEGIEKATRKDIVSKVINFVLNKNNWKRPATECGYLEVVKVEEIGEMDAKLDTGNGSYCVIHADEYEVDGDKVNWRIGKREFSHKIEGIKTINVGGIETKKEDRPVLSLKVTFNNETYDMKFTLSNRKGFSTPILLNRKFLRLANLSVNSAKKYVLTTKKSV